MRDFNQHRINTVENTLNEYKKIIQKVKPTVLEVKSAKDNFNDDMRDIDTVNIRQLVNKIGELKKNERNVISRYFDSKKYLEMAYTEEAKVNEYVEQAKVASTLLSAIAFTATEYDEILCALSYRLAYLNRILQELIRRSKIKDPESGLAVLSEEEHRLVCFPARQLAASIKAIVQYSILDDEGKLIKPDSKIKAAKKLSENDNCLEQLDVKMLKLPKYVLQQATVSAESALDEVELRHEKRYGRAWALCGEILGFIAWIVTADIFDLGDSVGLIVGALVYFTFARKPVGNDKLLNALYAMAAVAMALGFCILFEDKAFRFDFWEGLGIAVIALFGFGLGSVEQLKNLRFAISFLSGAVFFIVLGNTLYDFLEDWLDFSRDISTWICLILLFIFLVSVPYMDLDDMQ